IGGKEPFIATGHFSDGSAQNLTSTVTWGSGTTGVATITAAGVATGVSPGTSTISATLGAVSGSTVLTITATTGKAYVGDFVSATCCLDVIDISTNQLVKQIPLTTLNEPLGITPDQSRVYIPDNAKNLLDVIDTTTNTLVNTIPIGNGTTAVVVAPNGQFGYVSDLNDSNVVVYNIATSAVVKTIPIGFSAGWITITPDGSFVYAQGGAGQVAVINTATNTLASTFTLPTPAGQAGPGCGSGPAFNPQGTVGYFAQACSPLSATSGTVNVLSIPSNTPIAAITVGGNPIQPVVTPDGTRLYVANINSNTVSVIDTATNAVIATIPVGSFPQSVAITPDGAKVYVANSGGSTVSVIQTSTNTVTASIQLTVPFGIVIASPPLASAATTLTLSPSNLVFGPQVDGTLSASQTINVKNPGGTPVTLTSISLTGPNIGDFRLTNGCPIPPATLGAGLSCNLQIASDPTTNGPRVALVTINSTNGIAASTQSAPLSGTGISLVSIAVTPANPSVTATKTVQFTATGTFSDTSTQNLTNSVTWTSSSTGIATINASGLATGVASGGPITITATSGNIFGTTQLTVTPLVVTFPLNVTLIGTGTGSVTDNLGSINCVNTAGVITGTCSANYPAGTVVNLTASATQPSTFAGWLQACSGTGGCSVTMNSAQAVTASFVPPPQALPLPFTPGTNVSGQVAFDCPSNPNPTPGNPCLDPNAHAAAFTIGQVLTPFTLTVVSTEVPPTNGDGICENGRTPGQDLDCRFGSFFTFQTKANGDRVVPLCDPYANGNCVVYSVFFQNPGQEPDPSMYVGPVNWNITFNNGTFVPPAPWTGSTPRLYYDPSGFVVPNSPYGTDCTTPMLIGNPGVPTNPAIFCQFVFDITTIFDASKKVDPLIGGKTKVFSDAIVAFPPVFAPVVTVTTTPDAATVTAGSPIGFTITVSNSALAVANNVSLNTPLPGGTNVNWTISPAFAGPGTCSITGAQGSQVLNCAFGTLSQSASASLHILSASSAVGTAISPSTVLVGSQQLLSIGSIVVQPIPVTFSGLTASQTIPAGTSSVTLGGVVGNGTQFAPSGETVSITINGNKQTATIGSNGAFSLHFPTSLIPGSTTPYPITYSYAGDSLLSSATNSSTTLTVVSPPAGVNLSATLQSATIDGSGNYVFTIRVTNSGGTAANAATINTAVLTTVIGTTRVTTASKTPLPVALGTIASLSSVTTTLTFPANAGPPGTAGAISLGFVFTGGSAGGTLKATLP
ncbi:MAG TPA: choice-of-anchor D domain-containing protein, partial [Candidatus Acidoferrum sp.]|nr:choice-of-anchor D domain-containing protein [Candidatus Acidoferrum sp.]